GDGLTEAGIGQYDEHLLQAKLSNASDSASIVHILEASAVKLTLTAHSPANLIRAYASDLVRIGEQEIRRSCIVSPDVLITDWEPETFADLAPRHLDRVLELAPELVVLSTGATHQFAPAAIRAALVERRIGLEAMELGAACRTYNVLVQEERRV